MAKYWAIAPARHSDALKFQRCWEYGRENNVIAIGWDIGDVSPVHGEELQAKYKAVFDEPSNHGLHQLRKFYHEIQPGDRIVARGGVKKIVGVGTVAGPAYYSPAKGVEMCGPQDDDAYPNFLPVNWDDLTVKEFPNVVFGMHTVHELDASVFMRLVGEEGEPNVGNTVTPSEEEEGQVSPAQTEFVLEKYLQEFIVTNFQAVFENRFRIYTDDEGIGGSLYKTDVGILDILAREQSTGDFIVIELKKGKGSDQVVGQTLRYMGWVKEQLCGEGNEVRGIIICREADEKLDYALSMVPSVEVQLYKVDFKLAAPGGKAP